MYVTSISLSYVLLGIGVVALLFFIYFKVLVTKSGNESPSREKIIGNMKNPEQWLRRNNRMAYLSLFWCIISIAGFIMLKFFYNIGLVPIVFPFIYVAVIVGSVLIFSAGKSRASA